MTGGPVSDGLLPVDKPVGSTSHDIVAIARRTLGIRRIGHTGTLDPFASGLLLLLLGGATRLAEYLDGFPKEYVARARLGVTTTTDDPEGEVVRTDDRWKELTRSEVEEALSSFHGESEQRPPIYSAKKIGGRPAHRRVRAGESVQLEPAPVTVHAISLEEFAPPDVQFRVVCSTGTYVRALARDLGERLGVGAHLVGLRRVGIGPFDVDDAISVEELANAAVVEAAKLPPLAAVSHLPRVQVGDDGAARLAMGQALSASEYGVEGEPPLLAVAREGELVAVVELSGDRIQPKKVFLR